MIDHPEFEETGRAWLRKAIPLKDLRKLADGFQTHGRPGSRPAMGSSLANHILNTPALSPITEALGLDPAPVRLALFDKNSTANWAVPWHQDRVIAVAERHDLPGHNAWLKKEGYWHVEPPLDILERMVFIRLHIDASTKSSGSLQLALGSHKAGRVAAEHAATIAESLPVETCEAEPGDVLVVKALTLHRSASSVSMAPRRTIRIDFADRDLIAPPLRWAFDS